MFKCSISNLLNPVQSLSLSLSLNPWNSEVDDLIISILGMKKLRHKRLRLLPKVPELRITRTNFVPCSRDISHRPGMLLSPIGTWGPYLTDLLNFSLRVPSSSISTLSLPVLQVPNSGSSFSVSFRVLLPPLLTNAGSPHVSSQVSSRLPVYIYLSPWGTSGSTFRT